MRASYLHLIFLFFPAVLLGQDNIHFLDRSKGLSQNTITGIAQDQSGFLWIGTQNGLNKYDGNKYTHFFHDEDDSLSISNNNINALTIDDQNCLWLGTYGGGVHKINLRNGNRINYNSKTHNVDLDFIQDLHLSENQILWLVTQNSGLQAIDTKNGELLDNYRGFELSLLSDEPITTTYGTEDHLMVATWQQELIFIDCITGQIEKIDIEGSTVRCIEKYTENTYCLGTTEGLYLLNTKTKKFERVLSTFPQLEFADIISLEIDDKKNILLGTENYGLFVKTPNDKWFRYTSDKEINAHPILGNSIWTLFNDRDGNIWVGLYSKGLNLINGMRSSVNSIKKFSNSIGSSDLGMVSCLEADQNGNLWIGTEGKGLFSYTMESSKILEHNHFWDSNSDRVITSLNVDHNGKIWLGTWGAGIYIYDPKTKKYKSIKTDSKNHNLRGDYIKSIEVDLYGNIWIGCFQSGIDIFNHKLERINSIGIPELLSNQIIALTNGCKNKMHCGTGDGIIQVFNYDANGTIQNNIIYNESQDSLILPMSSVHDIYIENNCDLWIASASGLYHVESVSKKSKKIKPENNSLPSNSIHSILKHKEEDLWLATSNGLVKYNTASNQSTLYNTNDGLLHNEFSKGCKFSSTSGLFYFGSVEGINYFDPEVLKENENNPSIVLTNLEVNYVDIDPILENEISDQNINYTSEINLKHDQNNFTLGLGTLSWTGNESFHYEYQLEGFDPELITTKGGQNFVHYSNLEYGGYNFICRSINRYGTRSETKNLRINIIPPWWQSNLAKVIYLLLLALGIYAIYRYYRAWFNLKKAYYSELENKNEELERLVQVRTADLESVNNRLRRSNNDLEKFAHTASHDLKEPLRTVGAFVELIQSKYADGLDEKGKTYMGFISSGVNRMTHLISSILNFSKLSNQKLQLRNCKLSEIIKEQKSNLELLIAEKNANIIFDELDTLYCDPTLLGVVFYNLINNGLKFNESQNPKISITHKKLKNKKIQFTVSDNGIGINDAYINTVFDTFTRLESNPKYEGSGIGLSTCLRIIEKHGGKIWVDSSIGKGSDFHFTVDSTIS